MRVLGEERDFVAVGLIEFGQRQRRAQFEAARALLLCDSDRAQESVLRSQGVGALRLWQLMPRTSAAKIFVSITFALQSLAASLASKIAIEHGAGACRSLSVDRHQPMLNNDSRGIGSA
jgi:hypothetical protein